MEDVDKTERQQSTSRNTIMYTLHVKPVQGRPFTKPLLVTSLVIGRSRGCDLVLNDDAISRRHARLFLKGDVWFVEDLNSRNGTLLADQPVLKPTVMDLQEVVNLSGNTFFITAESTEEIVNHDTTLVGHTLLRRASDILNSNHDQVKDKDEQSLRSFASRLALINEVHNALSTPITSEELLDLILDRIFKHLKPEEACIFIKGEDGRLELAAHRVVPGLSSSGIYSQTLVREVAEGGLAAIVADVATDSRFSASESMVSSGIRSLVAAPLLDEEGCLGMIVLASRIAVRSFTEDDMAILVSLASLAALRIRNLALVEKAARALRDANATLENKVAERTAALAQTNEELRQKNEAILRRQNQLILQEKMASVGTMAAGVAHLIKNPLNFVKNLSEVSGEMVDELLALLDQIGPTIDDSLAGHMAELLRDLKANTAIVQNHGVRADQIVVSLMDYAREPTRVDRRMVDLNALVEKYTQFALQGRMAQQTKLQIELCHDHDPEVGYLAVFASDLSRTLIGIINNAVEAILERMRTEGPLYQGKIQTSTRRLGKLVEIIIHDNGIGIPENQWQNIFTPFFTTKHDEAHIGLGLSIGYESITQRHHGSLSVNSEPGQFTQFILRLPADAPPSSMP